VAWFLTWLAYSLALSAATAALVRLPGFRARAALRSAAWSVALMGTAALAWWPLLQTGAGGGAGAAMLPSRAAAAGGAPGPLVLPAVPGDWLAAGLAAWALGAVAWLGWGIREVRRISRLKRACESWTAEDRWRVAPWVASTLSVRRARLAWCDDLDGPALLGFGAPVIALPREHGARMTDEELQHVLLHEAAHLRRRDDWAALAELAVAGLLWINPFVHAARRSLGLAREMACDDWVVRQTAAPVAYARCLTTVADLRRLRHRASLVAAATGRPSVLARRVTRVLEEDRRPSARVAQWCAVMTPVAVGALAIVMIQAPPIVVDGRIAPATEAGAAQAGRQAMGQATMAPPRAAAVVVAERPRRTSAGPQGEVSRVTVSVPSRASDVAGAGRDPEAPRPPETVGEQVAAAPRLSGSAVPGFELPGVPAADPSVAASSVPNESTPWWGRAARVGSATSEGATAAGQKTASFFKRLGSSVTPLLNR
jgi:beta-lactamase regulating signal transducer with metallopeptidase domain